MFRNMRVRSRLTLGFVLVLAFMIAIVAVSLRQTQVSHGQLVRIVEVNNVRVQLANGLIDNARDSAIIVRSVILSTTYKNASHESISELSDRLAELRRSNVESTAAIKGLVNDADDPEGLVLLSKLEASGAAAGRLEDQVIQLALAGRLNEAVDLMFAKANPAVQQWMSEADAVVHHYEERTALRHRQADESAASARTTMFILGGLAIAICVAIVVLVTKSITKPLNLSVNAANRVASGDLAVDLAMAEKRGDELGILMQSLSRMVAVLRDNRDVMNRDITERERMDEELRAVSLYTRNLIEANLDPLVTISSDGKITDVNDATEQVTGVSRERLIGSDFAGYFTEPEKARAGYEQVFSQDVVRDYPLTIRHASGRTTDVLYNASVYKDEAGEAQGVFAAARDVTEQKRLELDVAERVKELQCLYGISALSHNPDLDLDEVFQEAANLLPPSWMYPQIACARVTVNGKEYRTENWKDSRWKQASDINVHGLRVGVVEVCYLEERPQSFEGPFLGEERRLIDAVAERLGRITERKRAEEELQEYAALKTGQTELADQMLGDPQVKVLCRNIITFLCKRLEAPAGLMYLASEDGTLSLAASYAHKHKKHLASEFKPGEGLVGQAALEQQDIILADVPENYFTIESGLGEAVPRHVHVKPIVHNGKVKAVIELGTLHEFAEFQSLFLNTVTEGIAMAVESAQARATQARLMEESQTLTEELQAQEEELRTTNEDLEEQTQALKTSEEELKTQQEELQVTNEELEEKNELLDRQKRDVEEARKDIEEQAEELTLASKYKSEFLANMSHELRTPLNSLLLLAQSLSGNKEGNLSEEQIESAGIIHSSGSDLLNLINEILDLSKIEAGRMDLQLGTVRTSDLADGVRASFGHMAEEMGLKLEVAVREDAPADMTSDRKRIEQVIRNLVSNAIKFTDSGGVTVTFAPPSPGTNLSRIGLSASECLAVEIKDTGIGITPEKQRIIFEAFHQVDAGTARKYGGTGLGLSISRELARLLGGEIQVESELGKGSTFTLYLPVAVGDTATVTLVRADEGALGDATPQSAAAVQIEDDRDDLKKDDRVILVVEDDPNFARLLHRKCREKGFKCLAAPTGEAGLELATKHQPVAIILDIRLPGMDGWAVLSALKEDTSTRHIPVHIVSAEDTSTEAVRRGAVGHATKPLSQEDLEGTFRRLEQVSAGKSRRVLVVEDDPTIRRETVKLIGDRDVKVDEAETGEQALEALRSTRYDCVVLDLGLPDMDGGELLEKLEKDGVELPPVIVHTARDLTRDEEAALREHAESVVIKDVRSQERLLDEVSLFLHRVVSRMPVKKRQIILDLHDSDALLRDKKVLIVDDDMRSTFAISHLLSERGMKTLKAENGERALRLLEEHPDVDIVLMDIMMPVMDGYEAMKRIRDQERFRKLPIITLTAKAMPEDREKCLAAGANDYLRKPVDQERLVSMLRVWLYR